MNNLKVLFLLAIFALLGACASNKPKGSSEVEILFLQAQKNVENGQYLLAIDRLDELKASFPLSAYVPRAEILKAEALFKQENYQDAIDVFENFLAFHQGHPKRDYVQWMIGESYFLSMPETIDRDLSMAYEAINSFTTLAKDFPRSKYVEKVPERIKSCNEFILKREIYIADFYFKTKKYLSASSRYKDFLASSAPSKMKREVYPKYVESLLKNKNYADCLLALETNSVVSFMSKDLEKSFRKKCEKGMQEKEL